ncbi:MAG: DUF5320 domain-containing protein [Thermodesulfobacteriota bacterium]|nr:DUF5320 domain-containing protein [Thermodesulfobacteriota bacterium]
MTGGSRGFCNPYGRSYGFQSLGGGRSFRGGLGGGFGRGRGYGRGFGWRGVYPHSGGWYGSAYNVPYGSPYTMNPGDEASMLKAEADAVKSELDAIKRRIQELESTSSES